MKHIIGLGSMRPTGVDMVYVQVNKLETETILSLDRSLRMVVQNNPLAEWPQLLAGLESDGFAAILHPRDNPVFIHSRSWDEHLGGHGQSFFVSFPETAPYELAGQLLLATPYPLLYTSVSADYLGPNRVIVINQDHDPVYADDLAWSDENQIEKLPIGPVILLREQFSSEDEFSLAKRTLIASCYHIMNSDGN